MESSIFLAKLIGPVFLTMGISVVANPPRIKRMAREILDSDAFIFMSGMLTLPAGLAIVITHNIWVAGWPVLITILGWIAIFAGITRVLMPAGLKSIGQAMIEKTALITVPGIVMVLLGAYLSYQGYFG